MMKYLTVRLKKDIAKGGMVIAPRRAGKTTAIIELLREDSNYYLMCFSMCAANNVRRDAPDVKNQIIGPSPHYLMVSRGKKIIIDEFFFNPAFYHARPDQYHCAVCSPLMDTVIYTADGKRLAVKRDDCFMISKKTLKMMDNSVKNLAKGIVSEPVNIKELKRKKK